MTASNQLTRAIDACRRAGLPVIHDKQCTCTLRGRLVVLASHDGLRVLWPYDASCPVHSARNLEKTSASHATAGGALSPADGAEGVGSGKGRHPMSGVISEAARELAAQLAETFV
jgi:hypothetical protein